MTTRITWRTLAALVLAAGPALGQAPAAQPAAGTGMPNNAAVLQRIQAEKTRLGGQISQATLKLRTDEASGASPEALEKSRAAQQQAVAEYRAVVQAELVARTNGLPQQQVGQAIADYKSAADAQATRVQSAVDGLATPVGNAADAADKARIYSSAESTSITVRVQQEVASEAARRLNPVVSNPYFNSSAPWQTANATQLRMSELLDKISNINVEESRLPSWRMFNEKTRSQGEVEEWKRRQERDANIQEYMRLAEGGVFVDPETSQPITGDQRDRIAKNAKLVLAERLQAKGIDASAVRTLFGWTDSRDDLGKQIEQEVKANNWYQALDLMNPTMSGARMPDVFRAMSGVVRKSVTDIHDWRGGLIPEGGNGGVSGWLYENFVAKQKVGARTGARISGYDGNGGELKEIDDRIDQYESQADAVVKAFNNAAATPDPKDLSAAEHKMLEQSGFIGKRQDGSEFYRMPANTNLTQNLQKDLNLPGASLLDMISGANLMKTVALLAAPEIAAAKVGVMLEGLEVGGFVIRVAQTGTQIVVNAAGTAIDQKLNVGKVDWDRIALDSAVLGVGLPIVSGATGALAEKTAAIFKDPAKRKLAEVAIKESLGLTTDSALMTYWSAAVDGKKISYEDFLANLFNGVVGRVAPVVGRTAAGGIGKLRDLGTWVGKGDTPEWFKQELAKDPALTLTENQRQAEVAKQSAEAAARLSGVLGGDTVASPKELATPENVAKITEALDTGRLRWNDLKALYQEAPWLFKPVMGEVVAYRERLAQGILGLAQRAAVKQIQADYSLKIQEANAIQEPAARAAAIGEANAFLERETRLAQAEVKTPGSGNLTSDIDRSSQSAYVRNQIKKMADAAFGRHGAGLATTAQAYDLNEYINVFDIINRQKDGPNVRDATFRAPDGQQMSQADAVEASSMAAAMMHMTSGERAKYAENRLRESNGDPAVARKLKYANDSLARGETELNAELARMAQAGVDITNPDAVIRARDKLYGERTAALNAKEAQLEKLDKSSQAAKDLAAEIQRDWTFALREGIEAYSDFTGLDVVVQKAQMQKVTENGVQRDKTIRDLINDPGATGEQLGISKQEATGMINDQVTMIAEHVNAYSEGHENAVQTATALSKYAERSILGAKLRGDDINSGDLKRLNDISEKLVKARKDPTQLAAALAAFDTGSADGGVRELAKLLEKTLPGLNGVFELPLTGGQGNANTGTGASAYRSDIGLIAVQRERERERRDIELRGGAKAVVAVISTDIASMESELKALKDEKARDAAMAGIYSRKDWGKVRGIMDIMRAIRVQINALPNLNMFQTNVGNALSAQYQSYENQLGMFKNNRGNGAEQASPDEVRRDKRIGQLEKQIGQAKLDLGTFARKAEADAANAAGLPTSIDPLLKTEPDDGGIRKSDAANLSRLFLGEDPDSINARPNDTAAAIENRNREELRKLLTPTTLIPNVPGAYGGQITINPDGTLRFVWPENLQQAYPGIFGPNGGFWIYAPGTTIDLANPPEPIAVASPTALPTGNVTLNADGSFTYGGVPFSGFPGGTSAAPNPGLPGSIVFTPNPKKKTPPDGAAAAAGGGGGTMVTPGLPFPFSSSLGEQKGMGWGESETLEPEPDPPTPGGATDGPGPTDGGDGGGDGVDLGGGGIGGFPGGCCTTGIQMMSIDFGDPVTVPGNSAPAGGRDDAALHLSLPWTATRLVAALQSFARGVNPFATATVTTFANRSIGMPPAFTVDQARAAVAQTPAPQLRTVITSTGNSQGEAFQMQVINEGRNPVKVYGNAVVVEPLKKEAQEQVKKQLARVTGSNAVTKRVEAYCLQYALAPPSPGMLFQIAAPALQNQFKPAGLVMTAARQLAAAGQLRPDSNPKTYLESIKQYAIWTKFENWDQKKFGAVLLEKTKQAAAAAKANWTGQMESALLAAVPNRWRDIQTVLVTAQELAK